MPIKSKFNQNKESAAYPPKLLKCLRNISGLMTFNKIEEKYIAEMIISDIKDTLDPSQYGNQKGISINHYLIKIIFHISGFY